MAKCTHKTCTFEGTDRELQAHFDYVERNGGHEQLAPAEESERMVDPNEGRRL